MFCVLSFDQSYDLLLFVGAFFLAIGSFYQWAWKPFVKGDEERAQRIADTAAERATQPILDAVGHLDKKIDTVRGEVTTNGGKSLKDVVLDTRTKQVELAARFDQHMQEANHG